MKQLFKIIGLLILTTQLSNAQTSKTFYLGLGGSSSSFQDLKYSSLRYGGAGGSLEIHFQKSTEKAIWNTGLTTTVNQEKTSLFTNGKALVVYPKIHFSYLRKINDQLYIGGKWDIMEMYFRQISGLGNNGIYYNTGSYLSASGLYQLNVGAKKLNIGLDLGILGYFKESTSFTFSASQNILENGNFDYQDGALSNPFGFKYFVIRPTWAHFRLSTKLDYQLNRRFSVGYQWHMRRFAEVKNYPVTAGANTISLRYHFMNKSTEIVND